MKDIPANNIRKRSQAIIFRGKAILLQLKRGFENFFSVRTRRYSFSDKLNDAPIIAESKTPLWTESTAQEQLLLAGKAHNLRLAIKKINNLEIPAGEVFSFWKHIGNANRWRGFVVGRELREGCIIPNIGGGLCQLSNALYDAALQANFEIVERHAHTQIIPGSLAEKGRDATVFWNYIDLRFRAPNAFRIEAFLGKDHLTVKFKSDIQKKSFVQIGKLRIQNSELKTPQSCATCGVQSCFRSLKPETNLDFGKTAFLVDEFSPEFDEYIQQIRAGKDLLSIPIDGRRFKKANYAWNLKGFSKIKQSFFVTAIRSYKSRKLAAQGAARQNNLLAMYKKLAESYAKNLSYDVTHLVVQQNLLPFLWKSGVLGGRTFDVLMTSLPMRELQKRLDFAHSLYPESKTLGDFRADEELIETETQSLQTARKIITPHTEIASLYPEKSELLGWQIPKTKKFNKTKNEKFTIVFPASTVGRKGSYELREAIRGLDVKLILLGAEIEGENFWRGFEIEKGDNDWLEKADLVVLPAFVEHKPRRLLLAAANEIPVIASDACGLGNIEKVETVRAGDAFDLREKIFAHLVKAQTSQTIKL